MNATDASSKRVAEPLSAPLLSVVLPVFNEEHIIPELHRRLSQVMEEIGETYEIIFVNDGSNDQSLRFLQVIAALDAKVTVVSFSRNFGHQVAITAGLDYSRGQAVIVMDSDLQDPPEALPALIEKWREGYDVVYAVRARRPGESLFKRGTAALFYRVLKSIAKVEIPLDAGDFRLMSRRAVNALQSLRERHRFVRGLSSWVGFRQTSALFVRESRYAGETKYPLRKMLKFACDGLTSFSSAPLQLAMYLGFGASGVSFFYLLYAIGLRFFSGATVPGWASLIVAILFIGGVQLISLGIMGEYIGRIYEEIKQRPLYIVEDVVTGTGRDAEAHLGEGNGAQPDAASAKRSRIPPTYDDALTVHVPSGA